MSDMQLLPWGCKKIFSKEVQDIDKNKTKKEHKNKLKTLRKSKKDFRISQKVKIVSKKD